MLRIASLPFLGRDKGRLTPRSFPVMALLALLVILLVSLASAEVWRSYRVAIERGELRAVSAAQTASAHVRWLVTANLQALERIESALVTEDGQLSETPPEGLADITASLPGGTSIWIIDAQGTPLVTTDDEALRITVADREYFQALRDGSEWYVSTLLVGRSTGRKVFAIGRRLDFDGRFLGAVVATIPIEVMSKFWASLDVGPDSSVGLIRDDGWLVARHPEPEDTLDLGAHPLFTDHLAVAPSGFYHSAASPADGIARIVGYQRVESLPLVAVVGISRDWALAGFHAGAKTTAMIGVPLALVLIGLTAWVSVLLRRDEENRARLTQALEHNKMLVREAHHRVKNNLQAVSAMLRLSPGSAETKADFSQRIAAMAALHEQVYLSDQFEAIRLDEYVRGAVARLQEAFPHRAEITCDLDAIEVPGEQGLPLALIVTEVVSNALKHAFGDERKGSIGVTLRREGSGRAVLCVEDDGPGFVPDQAKPGLGMRLVQGFANQLGGVAKYRRENGTRFTLDFPI